MLSDSKCNEFTSFFSEKISNIRKEIGTSSCNTEVTQIRQQSQKEVTISVFKTIDSKILEEIVQYLKSSTCYLDTLPTSFFKSVLNCLEADLLEVVNTSLLSGTFPNSLKTAVVKPLLKKRNLDNTMLSNYRPISNLPFIGKIIEKVVFNQLNNYLNSNGYLDNFQSGFRVHHSTETALIIVNDTVNALKIINDIRFNSDSGKISVLVLLDLSAAFDITNYLVLQTSYYTRQQMKAYKSLEAYNWRRSLKPLQMIQNEAARLVFNEPKRAHVTPLFVSLHWLPVAARIQFKTLMLAYRTTTGSAPTYFHSLLRIYIPSRSLRSASERRLVVPSQRGSKSLSRTFSFTIPGRWNDLPTPIRNIGSLSIFKQQLKTHLFQLYLTT